MKEWNIVKKPIGELKPAGYNPRKISERAREGLTESLTRFGIVQPIVWNKRSGNIVGGHQRFDVLVRQGVELVEVVEVDLDDRDEAALNVALNNPEIQGEWDMSKIETLIKDIHNDNADLFSALRIDDLAEKLKIQLKEASTDPNSVPPPPSDDEVVSREGAVYSLGNHRVLCGSCTETANVERLFAGKQAKLLLTDPPYNVAYEGQKGMTIDNDSMEDVEFRAFLVEAFSRAFAVMKPGAAFYIWHADSEGFNFRAAVKDCNEVVRQCLIWVKNSIVMGRQDYQWKHEPCQPAGTMVRVPGGWKAIEDLKDGDMVVGFDTYSGALKGLRDGIPTTTASRHYSGNMYSITCGEKTTRATDNHDFSVRFNSKPEAPYCTYLMKRGDWFRVGRTKFYDARQFGLKTRMHQEKADCAWIIGTYKTALEAQMGEQFLSVQFGIPSTHWEPEKAYCKTNKNGRTVEMIEKLYSLLSPSEQENRAKQLLKAHGRNYEYPLLDKVSLKTRFSRRVAAKIKSCNLIEDLMQIPVPLDGYVEDSTFEWKSISRVEFEDFDGVVYSLSVPKWEHYVADGIITHNCLYGWKSGGAHGWYADRKQTTVLLFDKPTRNDDHPTMKPIDLFSYQMANSSLPQDIVYDPFLGSGTSVISAEKLGRICYGFELAPKYCDVIRRRWAEMVHGEDCDWCGLTPEVK